MVLFNKIVNSRKVLKEILSNEWDTDTIPILSINEIDVLYNNKPAKNSILNLIGNAGKCSITIDNKMVPEHKLHIIYYNFPEINKNTSKVTKSIINKIYNIYEFYNITDNLLIIINESINDTINKLIDVININNKKVINENETKVNILVDKFKNKGLHLNNNYFRTVHIVSIDSIQRNLFEHNYIPKHIPIRDINKIEKIITESNATINQLPIINKYDIMSTLNLLNPNDIIDIKRISTKCGNYSYYRVCK